MLSNIGELLLKDYSSIKEFILKKYKLFIADKYCWVSCIFSFFLLGFHIYQFIDSNFLFQPLIRIIYCFIYPFVIFFFGREAILFLFILFALFIEQFADFSNYTSFFIIVFFLFVYSRFTIPALIIYILDVIIVCESHGKSSIHLVIHFINCGFIFVASKIIFNICVSKIKKNSRKLDLDETDRFILQQLSKGAKQKEIEGFSENTVSKRLKKMRDRNFCESNSELLMLFIAEIQ